MGCGPRLGVPRPGVPTPGVPRPGVLGPGVPGLGVPRLGPNQSSSANQIISSEAAYGPKLVFGLVYLAVSHKN